MVDELLLAQMLRGPVFISSELKERTWRRMRAKLCAAGFGLVESGRGIHRTVRVLLPSSVSP